MVERGPVKTMVVGSSPTWTAILDQYILSIISLATMRIIVAGRVNELLLRRLDVADYQPIYFGTWRKSRRLSKDRMSLD